MIKILIVGEELQWRKSRTVVAAYVSAGAKTPVPKHVQSCERVRERILYFSIFVYRNKQTGAKTQWVRCIAARS